jgi:hypothetical protein
MGNYNTVLEAKNFLLSLGFEVSANVYGEIEYLNIYGKKLTMRKYKDGSCKLW